MAHDDHAGQIERVLRPQHREVRERETDVIERTRPTTARVADAPVLHVPRRDPVRGEIHAEVTGMGQVVDRLPVAAVDHHHDRMRTGARRQPQVTELQRLRPVHDAGIRNRGRRLGQYGDALALHGGFFPHVTVSVRLRRQPGSRDR